jgi:hypothetical protein
MESLKYQEAVSRHSDFLALVFPCEGINEPIIGSEVRFVCEAWTFFALGFGIDQSTPSPISVLRMEKNECS